MMATDNIIMNRYNIAVKIFLEASQDNDHELQLVTARWIDAILAGNHKPLNAERPSPDLPVWSIVDGVAGEYHDTRT